MMFMGTAVLNTTIIRICINHPQECKMGRLVPFLRLNGSIKVITQEMGILTLMGWSRMQW